VLQEATFEMTATAFQKEKEADKALYVQFYPDVIDDVEETEKQARLICREVDFVMIMVPGDKFSIIRRPVQERDKQRFSDRYQAFKAGRSQETASGTPLKVVSWLTKSQVRELEFLGCHTLENLAGMPDSTADKFLQVKKLKQLAKDAIQAAKDSAPLVSLRNEIDKKDLELAELKRIQGELITQVQQLQNAVMNQAVNHAPQARAASK